MQMPNLLCLWKEMASVSYLLPRPVELVITRVRICANNLFRLSVDRHLLVAFVSSRPLLVVVVVSQIVRLCTL